MKSSVSYTQGLRRIWGPAGTTLVIARDDLILKDPQKVFRLILTIPYTQKTIHLYNTPPVFSIYATMLVLKKLKADGGLAVRAAANEKEGRS